MCVYASVSWFPVMQLTLCFVKSCIMAVYSSVVFCPGYLEWCLDSVLHLVLFIQFILSECTIYVLSERWLIHLSGGAVPTSVAEHW